MNKSEAIYVAVLVGVIMLPIVVITTFVRLGNRIEKENALLWEKYAQMRVEEKETIIRLSEIDNLCWEGRSGSIYTTEEAEKAACYHWCFSPTPCVDFPFNF